MVDIYDVHLRRTYSRHSISEQRNLNKLGKEPSNIHTVFIRHTEATLQKPTSLSLHLTIRQALVDPWNEAATQMILVTYLLLLLLLVYSFRSTLYFYVFNDLNRSSSPVLLKSRTYHHYYYYYFFMPSVVKVPEG